MNSINTSTPEAPQKSHKLTRFHAGWNPGRQVEREDMLFSVHHPLKDAPIPDFADNSTDLSEPPIDDQGELGSCVPNEVSGAADTIRRDRGMPEIKPSRLFIYYNGRSLEGTVNEDSGLTVADGVDAMAKTGGPDESVWPYDISKFTERPSFDAYNQGLGDVIVQRYAIQTIDDLKRAIAGNLPVIGGFECFGPAGDNEPATVETLTADNPVLDVPGPGFVSKGGHCIGVRGYNATDTEKEGIPAKCFKIRNSWGPDFCQKGYFFMTEAQVANLSDIWAIELVGSEEPAPAPTPTPTPAPPKTIIQEISDFITKLLPFLSGNQAAELVKHRDLLTEDHKHVPPALAREMAVLIKRVL